MFFLLSISVFKASKLFREFPRRPKPRTKYLGGLEKRAKNLRAHGRSGPYIHNRCFAPPCISSAGGMKGFCRLGDNTRDTISKLSHKLFNRAVLDWSSVSGYITLQYNKENQRRNCTQTKIKERRFRSDKLTLCMPDSDSSTMRWRLSAESDSRQAMVTLLP